jgi:hypothetical protein
MKAASTLGSCRLKHYRVCSRAHLVVYKVCTRQSAPRKMTNLPSAIGESASDAPLRRRSGHNFAERLERALAHSKNGGPIEHRGEGE